MNTIFDNNDICTTYQISCHLSRAYGSYHQKRARSDNDFSLILLPLCNTFTFDSYPISLSPSLSLSHTHTHTHTLSLPFSLSHSPLQGGKKELMKEAQVRREALAVRANVGIREVSVTALSSLYCSSPLFFIPHRTPLFTVPLISFYFLLFLVSCIQYIQSVRTSLTSIVAVAIFLILISIFLLIRNQVEAFITEFSGMRKMMMKNLKVSTAAVEYVTLHAFSIIACIKLFYFMQQILSNFYSSDFIHLNTTISFCLLSMASVILSVTCLHLSAI